MSAETISSLRRDLVAAEERSAELRSGLARELHQAQQAGATIAQLMEWTGYSRRQVFNLLGSVRSK